MSNRRAGSWAGPLVLGSGMAAIYVVWLLYAPAPLEDVTYVYKLVGGCAVAALMFAWAWRLIYQHDTSQRGLRTAVFVSLYLIALGALFAFWPDAKTREAQGRLAQMEADVIRLHGTLPPQIDDKAYNSHGASGLAHRGESFAAHRLEAARREVTVARDPWLDYVGMGCLVGGALGLTIALAVLWNNPAPLGLPPQRDRTPGRFWADHPRAEALPIPDDPDGPRLDAALGITQCPSCKTWVVPKSDGTCPACQIVIGKIAE